jgi:hypothetical protein
MKLKKIFVDEAYRERPFVSEVLKKTNTPWELIRDPSVLDKIIRGASDPVQAAKRYLLLTGNRGAFVRKLSGNDASIPAVTMSYCTSERSVRWTAPTAFFNPISIPPFSSFSSTRTTCCWNSGKN